MNLLVVSDVKSVPQGRNHCAQKGKYWIAGRIRIRIRISRLKFAEFWERFEDKPEDQSLKKKVISCAESCENMVKIFVVSYKHCIKFFRSLNSFDM